MRDEHKTDPFDVDPFDPFAVERAARDALAGPGEVEPRARWRGWWVLGLSVLAWAALAFVALIVVGLASVAFRVLGWMVGEA